MFGGRGKKPMQREGNASAVTLARGRFSAGSCEVVGVWVRPGSP